MAEESVGACSQRWAPGTFRSASAHRRFLPRKRHDRGRSQSTLRALFCCNSRVNRLEPVVNILVIRGPGLLRATIFQDHQFSNKLKTIEYTCPKAELGTIYINDTEACKPLAPSVAPSQPGTPSAGGRRPHAPSVHLSISLPTMGID